MQELFNEKKGLAEDIAGTYGKMFPHHADDIKSEAYQGLWYALVNKPQDFEGDDISPWCVTNICRFIRDYIRTTGLIHPKGHRKVAKRIFVARFKKDQEIYSKPVYVSLETKDLIEKCISDNVDREIIDLRSQGFNDREISVRLNSSNSAVQERRRLIRKRFHSLSA